MLHKVQLVELYGTCRRNKMLQGCDTPLCEINIILSLRIQEFLPGISAFQTFLIQDLAFQNLEFRILILQNLEFRFLAIASSKS